MLPSNYLTATETQALLAEGKITVEQIIKDHQTRYEERNGQIRAWVCVGHEKANRDIPKGPLTGVVIGVKDNINTKDFPTEYGSTVYKGCRTDIDAPAVALLRHAGAHIIGKNTVSEFACGMVDVLKTTNPFDKRYQVGSSSAGPAAAVSDYQCHVSIATQATASVNRPATYCGVFGYMPTYDLISLEGVKPCPKSIDTLGLFGRSVTDIELVARTLGAFKDPISDSEPSRKTIKDCRFGFFKTDLFDTLASDRVKIVWEHAKTILQGAGAFVEDTDLGGEFDGWEGNAKTNKLFFPMAQVATYKELVVDGSRAAKAIVAHPGNAFPRKEYVRVLDELAALRPKVDTIASRYDAVISPATLVEAPLMGERDVEEFCSLWSGLHTPTIVVPGFAGPNGLPIGLTLIAPRYYDERLLQTAKLVAEVFIGADDGLKRVPAPEGAVHLRP